ncbi:S8 family peptidase, partial [bacterium BMS3Abin03]|nr:S8 family peptidase [bacterium BMS3Abin03]
MSYGYWDTYHDGTSIQDQKVDWCYSNGVPVFLAAGNFGSSKRHFSGTVSANGQTNFIKVNVTNALEGSTRLYFNLVWFDGLGIHNSLNLKYYDGSLQEITDVYNYPKTESSKGTESQYSVVISYVPAGNSIYYLKVENNSSSSQTYHIYESYNNGTVTFENPDPDYTIATPSTATYGFSVGAFTTREQWISYNGSTHTNNEVIDGVASYSSRGPRIDGLQKPDILAPGGSIISIRDRDVLTTPDANWIDNDGNTTGDANYYVMEGTSMAAPQCAGAAALFLSKYPDASPLDVYNALRNNASVDSFTGAVPNSSYGYGKLDIYSAINSSPPLPVELISFSSVIRCKRIILKWETQTEINNYGFEIQRSDDRNEWNILGFVEGNGNSNSPKSYSYFDEGIKLTGKYYYRLRQIDNDGSSNYSEILEVNIGLPDELELKQNYPNPFNPTTTISFSIPQTGEVVLTVYNALGESVKTVAKGFLEQGEYSFSFNAEGLTSGIYIYRLRMGETILTRKMLLLK